MAPSSSKTGRNWKTCLADSRSAFATARVKNFCLVLAWSICLLAVAQAQSARQEVQRGQRAYAQGRYADAERHFRAALQIKPDIQSWYNLGNALYAQQQYQEAAQCYRQAAEQASDPAARAFAWYNLGNAQFALGNLPAALEAYQKALRNHPHDADIRHNMEAALKALRQKPPEAAQPSSAQPKPNPAAPGQQPASAAQNTAASAQSDDSAPTPHKASKSLSPAETQELLRMMERQEQYVRQHLPRAKPLHSRSAKDW